MKVIVSHDVDHFTVTEHFSDLIIPKFIARMYIELFLGKISIKEVYLRWKNIFRNKWNNIEELLEFDEKNNIPSTFFVGVNNGLGLNYGPELSNKIIKNVISRGFDCGVHGISINKDTIDQEFKIFSDISGLIDFGIRMHYLRNDVEILKTLSSAGYLFDSTDYGIKSHYRIGKMTEFPLHIMEIYETDANRKWQTKSIQEAVDSTIIKIQEAEKCNVDYLTILFHDFYFDDSFITRKKWYIEIVTYCKSMDYGFVNYKDAVYEDSGAWN